MTESLEWELSSTLFYLTQTFLSMIHVFFYYRKLDMYMQSLTLLFSTRAIGGNKIRRRANGTRTLGNQWELSSPNIQIGLVRDLVREYTFLMVCCILLHQFKPKFRKLSDESLQIKTKHLEIGVTITKLTNCNNMDIFIYLFLFCIFLVGVLSCAFKD